MDTALVQGLMAAAVLSATLTQGFRLWRAEHTSDPVRERRAAVATWLLVVGVAVAVSWIVVRVDQKVELSPHAHEPEAFGFSIEKPEASRDSFQSMTAPCM